MNVIYYQSPIGILKILGSQDHITRIEFVETKEKTNPNELLEKTIRQLEEYFSGKRTEFDLPVKQPGTPFQQSVWKLLTEIP